MEGDSSVQQDGRWALNNITHSLCPNTAHQQTHTTQTVKQHSSWADGKKWGYVQFFNDTSFPRLTVGVCPTGNTDTHLITHTHTHTRFMKYVLSDNWRETHTATIESFSVTLSRITCQTRGQLSWLPRFTAQWRHGSWTPERTSDGELTSPLENTSRTCTHQVIISRYMQWEERQWNLAL